MDYGLFAPAGGQKDTPVEVYALRWGSGSSGSEATKLPFQIDPDVSEPTGCAGGCLRTDTDHVSYCNPCDLSLGLPGLRVTDVEPETARLAATVESAPTQQGCRSCRVIAGSHGRRSARLVDATSFGRPVRDGVAQANLTVPRG